MVIGLILAAFAPLGFIFAFLPWHIYALQALYAFGMGIAGALGGILASTLGFQIVFVFVSVLAFVGAILPNLRI